MIFRRLTIGFRLKEVLCCGCYILELVETRVVTDPAYDQFKFIKRDIFLQVSYCITSQADMEKLTSVLSANKKNYEKRVCVISLLRFAFFIQRTIQYIFGQS